MQKRRWLFAILFSAMLAITVLIGGLRTDKATAQQGENQQKLLMVTSADYPPYEFRDTASGNDEIIGFDVDIAKHIAKDLGFELQVKDTDFNGLIPALQSHRADFAMAGMTPTPERRKNVDFSDMYYEAKNTIVAKKGSNLKKPEDLAGGKVGVQLGFDSRESRSKNLRMFCWYHLIKQVKLLKRLSQIESKPQLLKIQSLRGFVANNPELEFNTIPNTEAAGFCHSFFPKVSDNVNNFNRVIQQMKNSGELEKLVKKWFDNNGKN